MGLPANKQRDLLVVFRRKCTSLVSPVAGDQHDVDDDGDDDYDDTVDVGNDMMLMSMEDLIGCILWC